MMNNKRNAGLDILRVLSMLMVVSWHFLCHGGLVGYALKPVSANWFLGNLLYSASMPAVNCFVLISGYFLCTAQFKAKRVSYVWAQTVFYSVLLYAIFGMDGDFSVLRLASKAIVLTMNRYWFVTAYLLMYLVSPFLNKAIHAMDKRAHFMCCVVLLGVFSVLHNVVYFSDFGFLHDGYSFLWFCILYVVAAYVHLHVKVDKKSGLWGIIIYILSTLVTAIGYSVVRWKNIGLPDSFFFAYNGVLAVVSALGLLMAFRSLSCGAGMARGVSFLAPLTFGVYLIHDHPAVRPILWGWLKPSAFANNGWMVLYYLLCVLGVFLACCIVEWLRQRIFQLSRLDKAIGWISDAAQSKVNRWLGHRFP